ncbi:MAG: L-erythro-3,5-diaminohexanoate dehydrogenase, partial [Vulcanimicrobiaceae bacterium]
MNERPSCEYGSHRVLEPAGALPQAAWRLDPSPPAREHELCCEVEALCIDSASFRQIDEACGGDTERIAAHVLALVRERGKLHNPVTGSGGMFVGRVREIGPLAQAEEALAVGDRIASLVSLSLTPLRLERIEAVERETARIVARGEAILFAGAPLARLGDDMADEVALAVLDVAGAPAQTRRLA